MMRLRVSEESEVTLPAEVLEALGVKPGEYLELDADDGVYVFRANPIDPSKPD